MNPVANRFDADLAGVFERRERDWRNGPVVYQVLVDRFAPPADLQAKRGLYPQPKQLRAWDDTPRHGVYLESHKLWSHEIEFWGGDLASLTGRLDHIEQLGAEVLYLNPIHLAHTHHKYDALDHLAVSPEYGSHESLQALSAELHRRGMKLVLDGVFNHMGRRAPCFLEAEADPASPARDWFHFGPEYPGGVRSWSAAQNLPELNLDSPTLRDHLYAGPDSVVRRFLREGIDGWRLDVASDLGFEVLSELTAAAHAEKPGSLVLGEIASYPKEWFPALDGVLHFSLRQILLRTAEGRVAPAAAQRMIERLVADADYEHLLKSWLYLENHDTERLATRLPEPRQRRLAQALMFTLPGAPNLYYGGEVDMQGGLDPEMRAPMRWDLVAAGHPALAWTRQLVALRRHRRALRVGNFRPVTAERLLGFERYTDRVGDSVFVLANPGECEVQETVMLANSKLMNGAPLLDLLPTTAPPLTLQAGLIEPIVSARSVRVLAPDLAPVHGYSAYKRVP